MAPSTVQRSSVASSFFTFLFILSGRLLCLRAWRTEGKTGSFPGRRLLPDTDIHSVTEVRVGAGRAMVRKDAMMTTKRTRLQQQPGHWAVEPGVLGIF